MINTAITGAVDIIAFTIVQLSHASVSGVSSCMMSVPSSFLYLYFSLLLIRPTAMFMSSYTWSGFLFYFILFFNVIRSVDVLAPDACFVFIH